MTELEELERKNKELVERNAQLKKARELTDSNAKLELENRLLDTTDTNTNQQADGATLITNSIKRKSLKTETVLTMAGGVGVALGLFSPWQGGTFLTIGVVCLGLVYLRRQGKL